MAFLLFSSSAFKNTLETAKKYFYIASLYNNRTLVYSMVISNNINSASRYSSYTALHSRHYNDASRPRLNTNRRAYNVKGSVYLARRHSRNRHRPCSE